MDVSSLFTLSLLGVSLITQAYFWLFIFNQIKESPVSNHQKNTLQISVIVCALNEETNLQQLIPKILNQAYEKFELIVVNDRSSDNTLQLLQSITDKRFNFITINETPKGYDHKKFALQEGIKKAAYDYILLTDADCIPNSPCWINEMQQQINTNKEIVLGVSFYQRTAGLLNHFIQFETYYTALQYLGFAQAGFPYMGVGRNLLYKKEAFIKNKQFDTIKEHLGGDDDLLLQQLMTTSNTATALHNNAQTTSQPKTTLNSWYTQKTRHLSAGKSYPNSIKLQLALLQGSHFLFYFVLFISIFQPQILVVTITAYLLRTIIIFSIFEAMSKKFGNRLTKKEILFGDFAYVIYFFVTGIFTLYTKKLKWE